jgi:hypothetical protein
MRSSHHSPHFYLALGGIAAAVVACALNLWAYYDEGLLLTKVSFAMAVLTAAILYAAWFWGVFLLMSGNSVRRLSLLLVHATLGSISPLLYTMAFGLQMDTLSSQPVGGLEVGLEFLGLLMLLTQLGTGRLMRRRRPRYRPD